MTSEHCPSRDEISACLLGVSADAQSQRIEAHIAQCGLCQKVADELEDADDALVGALRKDAGDDPHLGEPQLQRMLQAAAAFRFDLASGDAPPDDISSPASVPSGRLGQYELLEVIGQGGMGVVYKGRHDRLERIMAIKVLTEQHTRDSRALERFDREIKAIGRLDHENVVRAADAGQDEGHHYLVMDFVEGLDLCQLVKNHGPLTVADACEISRQVAVALQYIHENGMVHRDIKPSNVMLDRRGTTKLLDLGLSVLQENRTGEAALTTAGTVMGTFDYMSPEQCEDSSSVDIRADLYSVGCLLYELLAGHAPFAGSDFDTRGKKIIAHLNKPPKPIRDLRPEVPDSLAQVLDRLLAKEPVARYATPSELAADLEQLSAGSDLRELITNARRGSEARKDTEGPKAETFRSIRSQEVDTESPPVAKSAATAEPSTTGRRPWVPISIAAALVGFVALGVLLTINSRYGTITVDSDDPDIQVTVSQDGKQVAIVNADSDWSVRVNAGQYELDLGDSKDQFQVDQDTVTVRRRGRVTARISRKFPKERADSPTSEIVDSATAANLPASIESYSNGAMKVNLHAVFEHEGHAPGSTSRASDAVFVQNGKALATSDNTGTIRIWDMETGRLSRSWKTEKKGGGTAPLAVLPDGTSIVSIGVNNAAKLWNIETGQELQEFSHSTTLDQIAVSNDGKTLATFDVDGTVILWSIDGQKRRVLRGVGAYSKVLSPDGKTMATSHAHVIAVWDVETGQKSQTPHAPNARGLAFSPDGATFASASAYGLTIWRIADCQMVRVAAVANTSFWSIAFSPSGRFVVAGSDALQTTGASKLAVWDLYTGGMIIIDEAHKDRICNVAFSPGGSTVASASYDGTVKLWSIEPNVALSAKTLVANPASIDGVRSWTLETWAHRGCVRSVAYSPDGTQLATAGDDGVVRIFETEGGSFLRALVGHNDAVHCVRWSPDGQRLISADESGLVRVWSMPEGRTIRAFQCGDSAICTVAYTPWRGTLACGDESGMVYVWNTETGSGYNFEACDGSAVRHLAWRGEMLLSGGLDNTLKLWRPDPNGTQLQQTLKGNDTDVWPMALSPDGKSFAACSWNDDGLDFKVGVFDAETGERQAELLDGKNYRYANALVWSPDGNALAAGGCANGTVTVWDTKTRSPLWGDRAGVAAGNDQPTGDNADVYDVAFSPDGNQVALACASGRVVIRDTRTGDPLQTLPAQAGKLSGITVSPNGHWTGPEAAADELGAIVQTDEGQETLTLQQFANRYGWENDPGDVDSTQGTSIPDTRSEPTP